MSEELRPALRREEWAVALDKIQNPPHPETIATGLDSPNGAERALRHLRIGKGRDVNAVRVALHNAARAEGDAGKLTREDVDDLRAVLLMADVRAGSAANVLHRATAAIAKLAAILPPEDR